MSELNKDILYLIFEELQEDSKSLFPCLMINRLWCETVIPILWRNPWCYKGINYSNKISLFIIISCYLFDDIKEFVTNQKIQLPSGLNQSLLFDYFSYCRSINIDTINIIISIGTSLAYNQFFIQQKFYNLLMKKCPELKYFDMRTIKHQIFYFPEAKVRLESLCELECDTSIDSSYFYGLSQYCQYIQRLIIVNMSPKPNHGIAKLIEVQKNLKHFEWKDDHYDDFLTEDPYEKIFLALEKKADSLNRLKIYFQYMNGTLLQEILPKFYKLKILVIDDFLFFTEEQLEQLRIMVYHELEVVNINFNQLNVISNIIENSGRYLKKILLRPYEIVDLGFDDFDFNENSLNFICKVYENCPSIEHLSIVFPPLKRHFTEFEKLLKICQNLKSLLIVLSNTVDNETHENFLKNGEELLKVLINSGPINLKEIRFGNGFRFSLGNWEEFLEKWRIRRALSIFTVDRIYMREDYTKLINKYKGDGVIRSFEYLRHVDLDNYCINDL